MVAGLNLKATIHTMSHSADDDIGGALITGTVAYQDVAIRLSASRPTQASLEAGLEVDRVFDAVIVGRGVILNERDEIEITWPIGHPYYLERFRITGFQLDGRRRPFGHTAMTLSRIERSRSRQ